MTKALGLNNHSRVIKASVSIPQKFQPYSLLEAIITDIEASATGKDLKKNLCKKLFAHIHLDHAVRGTLLEGGNVIRNASYLCDCLDVLDISTETKNILKTAFQSLISCADAKQVETKVRDLNPGQALLVDGGYLGSSGGHAVLYEFCKKTNNTYDIYLYNTGEGSRYHPQTQKEGIPFHKAVIKFENVLAEELDLSHQNTVESSSFFQHFAELVNPVNKEEKSIELLYEKGFGHLAHKLVAVKEDFSPFIKGQHSGTCSWRVLQAFVLKTLGDSILYKKYVFELKLVTLALFFKKCEDECDLEDCMLLEEATTNLLRAAAKLYDANSLSEERAACVHVTLQEILDKLGPLKRHGKGSQLKQEIVNNRENFVISDYSQEKASECSIKNSPSPLLFSTIQPADFLKDVSKVMNHIELLLDRESKVFQIENFVRALPIPHADPKTDRWQNLSQKDLHAGLSFIQTVIELYGDLCLNSPPFFPSQQNTALSLLAIAHCLAIRIDRQQSGGLANYGIWNAFFAYADQQRFFICFEPKDQQRREDIYAYFTAIGRGKQQLFNFPSLNENIAHTDIAEISFFTQVIDRDPLLKEKLRERADKQLQANNGSLRKELEGVRGSVELVRKSVLITDNEWLTGFDKIRHLAVLRNISYITQQFSGWDEGDQELKSRKYQCARYICGSFGIIHKPSYWQKKNGEIISPSDPALEFHLLPSKEEVKELVKKLNSFSPSFSVVAKETESTLRLQPENIPLSYRKQLEATQCEPRLQPQKLLYYFQEHLEELICLNKQALFDLIFFKQVDRKVPLFQELKTNPFFIEQCTQFITAGLDRFSKERSEESSHFFAYLFFVRLLYRINQVCQDLQLTTIEQPSIQDQLNRWLESASLSLEDRACLHLHRMMQYAYLPNDQISAQHLQEIIPSWFFYNRSHVLEKQMPYFENRASIFIHRIAPVVEKLSEEQKKQMMSNLFQIIGIASIQEESAELSSQFPLYTITCGDESFWKIQLLTTQIENRKGLVESASTKELRKLKNYKDLFEDKVFNIYKSGGYYCFTCSEKGQIRIYKKRFTDDCRVECYTNGSWYEYIPEAALAKTKLPYILIEGHLHWYSKEHNEMLIISKAHNQVVAKVQTKASEQGPWQQKGFNLLQMKNGQQECILYPNHPLNPYLASINRIESNDWRLIFQDGHKKYTRVRFPRLYSLQEKELQFTFDESSQKAQLEDEKHFTIAQHIPGLVGCLENYLVLEDKKHNKKKVLIPVQEIKESKSFSPENISLDPKCATLENNQPLQLQKFTYLEFELHGMQLSAINKEGILLLAYLYLAQREYVKAVKYLHKIVKADVLSEISSTILYSFLKLSNLNQDQHPTACAIRLKALFLLHSKNNWKWSKEDEKHIQKNYITYTTRVTNVDCIAVLSAEEKEYYSSFSSLLEPVDFLQEWEKAQFLFHPNLPLNKLDNIDNLIYFCNKEDSPTIESILADLNSLKSLYEKAHSAESEESKLLISTRLHFIKGKETACKIIHFALKYPKLTPAFSALIRKEELKRLLENYQKNTPKNTFINAALTNKGFHSKPAFRSASEDSIFHHKKASKGLLHALPSSQIRIEQALILPHVEPKDRCFALSQLADICFDQVNTTHSEVDPPSNSLLEGVKKEHYKQAIEQQYEDFCKDLQTGSLINQNSKEFRLKKPDGERLFAALNRFLKLDALQTQKQKILELANTRPKTVGLYNDLLEGGRFKSRVDLKQLICAFLQGNANAYYALNSYLSVQEIQVLDSLLQKFMLENTKVCQVERALTLLESLKKTEDTASIEQELYTVLTEEMSYDPGHNRVLLVYEYRAKIRVRPNQAKLISEITAISETGEYKNLITQLIMGGGKTSVLASILLVILAKPPRLAVFIPPAAQFDTLRSNLKATQRKYFLQELIPIDLTRSEFSIPKLKEMYRELVEAQEKRWAVLIKKETIQSFALELQSCLYKAQDPEKITILRNIVQLFSKSGHAIFDECDLQLNPMQEVNFTIGEKKQIDPMYITCGMEIFKLLMSQHKIVNQSQSIAAFVGLSQNAQSFMKKEDYYQQVLPVVAQELFTSYKDTLLLSEEDRPNFLNYVQGKLDSSKLTMQEQQFLNLLRDYASSTEDEEREAAALTAWIKAQCTEILPLTLSKDTNRHYGRSKNTQELGKVVPYKGVNSPSTTQFGSPWEALAYQFQTALSQKLSIDLVRAYVQQIYQTAKYRSLCAQIPFEDTPEAKKCLELTGIALTEIKDEQSLKNMVENINTDPNKLLEVEADLATPLINYHPSYLNSNASHLFAQFASVTGFSGTPWNSSCYPDDLAENVLFDTGTEGRIVDIACQKAKKNPHAVHLIRNTEIQEVLKVCLQNNPRKNQVTAFIDVAGLFKDYDNLYVAEQILMYFVDNSRIECVLFFGRTSPLEEAPNTLMALRKGNSIPIVIGSTRAEELKKQGINPRSTFIYYDECHCEATDLPQMKDAVNLLSSNASMILRDLLQGMLRARGFLKSQDIEYVVHENTIKQLGVQGKPTFKNAILSSSLINQAERKAKETYRAFLHEIDHVLFKCAWEHVLNAGSTGRMIECFERYHTLFLHKSEIDPFKQYGDLLQEDFGLQALQNHSQERLRYWKQIQSNLQLQEKVKKELEQVMQKASTCKFLPNLVEVALPELGREQQIEIEQEVEQEVDVEIEKELESYRHKNTIEPRQESVWGADAIASKSFLKASKNPPKRAACSKIPKTYLLSDFIKSYPHLQPYYQIFEEQEILITENAIYTSCDLCSIFSNTQKPADQILIVREQEKVHAIILSIKEANTFKEHLARYKPKDMWLILPNADKLSLPSMNKSPLNLQQEMLDHVDWLAKTLWFINFFNGDISYLAAHADLTRTIITEKDKKLKIRFLTLKTRQDPRQKTLFCYLSQHVLEDRSRDNRLHAQQRRLGRKKIKERAERLTNQEIGSLAKEDGECIPFLCPEKIRYLKDPALIQCLNSSQIKEVLLSQIPHLLPSQIRFLVKPEQIQMINQDRLGYLLPLQLRHLALTQVADLPDEKIQYLEGLLVQQISFERICLLYREKNLLPSQLKELSKEQLRALLQENNIQEILPHLDNNQLQYIEKKEQIQAIPLSFVQYLTKTQFPSLTLNQSKQIPDREYKGLNTEQFTHKYKEHSIAFMLLKGWILFNLRVLAYICGIYLLKRISFLRFFGTITNTLDRSNMYLGISYRMLTGK